jgi:hypothetical protein
LVEHLDERHDHHGSGKDLSKIARVLRGRSGSRMLWRVCGMGSASLAALAIIGAGLLAGLIAIGPIEIGGVGPQISSALGTRFGHGIRFNLGHTFLAAHLSGLSLDIDGLTISSGGNEKILYAPHAAVAVDFVALLSGHVVPKRFEVFDLELRLVLLEDGSLAAAAGPDSKPFFELGHAAPAPSPPASASALGGASPPPPAGGLGEWSKNATLVPLATPRRAILMQQAAQAIRSMFDTVTNPGGAVAGIDRLGIKRGRLVIDDRTAKQEVVYKDLDLEFNKVPGGTVLAISAQGPSQRWSISAQASGIPGEARHFQVGAKNFSQDEFQLLMGSRRPGFDMDCAVSADLKIGLNANNSVSEAVGRVEAGPGFFRLDDPDQEALLIDKAGGSFHWNGTTRQIELDYLSYRASTTQIGLAGSVIPPVHEGEPWTIDVAPVGSLVLGPDRLGEQPVTIDRGQFTSRLFVDQKKLVIDQFTLGSGREGGVAIAGEASWEHGPRIRLNASLEPTSVRILKRGWPAFVAAPVRTWVLTHFLAGTVQRGSMRVDYNADDLLRMRSDRAPPDETVTIDFAVTGGSVVFLPGVPSIDDITGVGHITGRHGHFALSSGTMDASGRKIDLTEASFSVLDADAHPTPAEVKAHVAGSVEAINDVLSREAFRAFATVPLNPSTLKGQVDGRFTEDFLIQDVIRPEDTVLRVNAAITNFSADKLIGKEKLENATMSLAVDPSGLRAAGQGRMFGGPATFEMNRAGDKPMDAVVNVTLDEAARVKLGLSVIPGLVGPMNAKISANLGASDKIKAQVDLDLAKTVVTSALLGLSKPAGKPAKVNLTLSGTDNHLVMDPVVIDVGTLQARGAIDLGADNTFQTARFTSLKVSPGDDMKLDISKSDDTFKLTIRGNTIDGRPFLYALTQVAADSNTVPVKTAKAEHKELETAFKGFDIDLKSALLTGFNKQVLSGVELRLSKRGPAIQQFALSGKFGRAELAGAMLPNQRLRITTQDGGALLSFVDLYKHLETGQLIATMLVSDESLEGNLEINHFVLRDEPSMRQLVAQSVEETQQNGTAAKATRNINGNAVTFTKLKVAFQRAGSRLELKDATMYGSAIGLSVDGWLDFVHDRVGMTGTFVPVFAVNNFFSRLPLLGFFLGGESNEGLIAITFRISGLASSPTLSVNPLSVIAPGIFRKIFGALDSDSVPQESPRSSQPAQAH